MASFLVLMLALSSNSVSGNLYCTSNSNSNCNVGPATCNCPGSQVGNNLVNTLCQTIESCRDKTVFGSNIECQAERSCYSSSISTANTNQAGRIDCAGIDSCRQAQSIIADGDLQCNGKNSCYEASDVTVEGNTYCVGERACANIQDLMEINSDLYCTGKFSCQNSNFALTGSSSAANCQGSYDPVIGADSTCIGAAIDSEGDIRCTGRSACVFAKSVTADGQIDCTDDSSCIFAIVMEAGTVINLQGKDSGRNSLFINAPIINANGETSIAYSEIDSRLNDGSSVLSTMTVNVNGVNAGQYAEIQCRSGSTCNLNCASGSNACQDLEMKCENGATCNVQPAGCQGNNGVTLSDSTVCPTVTNI